MGIRSFLNSAANFLLLLSGICGFVMTIILFISRLKGIDTSLTLAVVCAALMVIYSLMNLIGGILSIRRFNKRKGPGRIPTLIIFSFIIGIVQVILSATNGIVIVHLIIVAVIAIVIPFFYIVVPKQFD